MVLSGANAYTGLTTVSEGTLAYGASNVIATAALLSTALRRSSTSGQPYR